jgi:hypothetical protein
MGGSGDTWVVAGRPGKKGNRAGPRRIVFFSFLFEFFSKELNGFDQKGPFPISKKIK